MKEKIYPLLFGGDINVYYLTDDFIGEDVFHISSIKQCGKAHACNPSTLGGRGRSDWRNKSVQQVLKW